MSHLDAPYLHDNHSFSSSQFEDRSQRASTVQLIHLAIAEHDVENQARRKTDKSRFPSHEHGGSLLSVHDFHVLKRVTTNQALKTKHDTWTHRCGWRPLLVINRTLHPRQKSRTIQTIKNSFSDQEDWSRYVLEVRSCTSCILITRLSTQSRCEDRRTLLPHAHAKTGNRREGTPMAHSEQYKSISPRDGDHGDHPSGVCNRSGSG